MTTKALVLMSVQHSLMDSQVDMLDSRFDSYQIYDVPAKGWSIDQMDDHIQAIKDLIKDYDGHVSVVFVSPIPYMMIRLQSLAVAADGGIDDGGLAIPQIVYTFGVGAFQTPLRKKVQKGDKIFYTVPKKGWKLVGVGLPQD